LQVYLLLDQNNNVIDEDSFIALEGFTSDLEERVSVLEQWKESISGTITAILADLELIKQWLFFFQYQGGDVCDAVENECGDIPTSSTECSIDDECSDGATSFLCIEDDVWQSDKVGVCNNPGTNQSLCGFDVQQQLFEECEFGCENGQCLQEPSSGDVIFRTNVDGGNHYLDREGAWIAIDWDNDNNLEGYGHRGRSSWSGTRCNIENACDGSSVPCIIVNTPTNDKVVDYGNSLRVIVCDELNHKQVNYELGDSDASGAELSSLPTEPYASNNQETYG